jgi:hypothetical protein
MAYMNTYATVNSQSMILPWGQGYGYESNADQLTMVDVEMETAVCGHSVWSLMTT